MGGAIDSYEKIKTIFGHPMNDKVESTTLLCFYQNEIIKEMKSSLDENFRNVLNLTSSINGNVLTLNRRMNAIEGDPLFPFQVPKIALLRSIFAFMPS